MLDTIFAGVRTWVFDLDNTLYPPEARLFDLIEARMTAYVMRVLGVDRDEADRLRKTYWNEHGTTLAGLMERHAIEPDPYLADVHDIDLGAIVAAPGLSRMIGALPGRRIVYTNGSRNHGQRVVAALGLTDAFHAIYGIEDAGYRPKPAPEAFARVFAADGLEAEAAAMFEDDPRNLRVPHELGMRTILVGPGAGAAQPPEAHVHYRAETLADFLRRLA